MAAWMTLEEESGTCTQTVQPHNGYNAGDFSTVWDPAPAADTDGQPVMSVVILTTGTRRRLW